MKVEEVLAAARQQTGLEDIGDPAILEGLEILLGDYEQAAGFTERGSQIAHGSIIAWPPRTLKGGLTPRGPVGN